MKKIDLQVICISSVSIDTDVPEELYEKLRTCHDFGYTLDNSAVVEEAVEVVEFLKHVCGGKPCNEFEFVIAKLN